MSNDKYNLVKLVEIANILNGYAFKSKNYLDKGIRIIRITNVQKGQIVDESPCYYPISTDEQIDKYFLFFNDILISLTGNVGRTGILPSSFLPAALNQRVSCLRVRDTQITNTKYLYYVLQQNSFERDCIAASKGVAQLNLSTKWLEKYEIPLPALSEQERIVFKIDELFSELDKGVEALKKAKEQLKIYRQAVLKDAFEGKLTDSWRKRHDNTNVWSTTDVVKIAKKEKHSIKAGPFGSALKKEIYVKSGYKIFGQEQVIAGNERIGDYFIDEMKYQELINCRVVPNDILISLVGTVGKVLILSESCQAGIINPRLIKISIDEKIMIAKFFKYYFESSYLRSLYKMKAHGATMDVLNLGMIKELPFPICTVDEQIQVISEIESRLSVCDKIEQTVNESLLQAESLKQSILKKAFAGSLI